MNWLFFSCISRIIIFFGKKKEKHLILNSKIFSEKKKIVNLRYDLLRCFSKHVCAEKILCILCCQNLFHPFKRDKIQLFRTDKQNAVVSNINPKRIIKLLINEKYKQTKNIT